MEASAVEQASYLATLGVGFFAAAIAIIGVKPEKEEARLLLGFIYFFFAFLGLAGLGYSLYLYANKQQEIYNIATNTVVACGLLAAIAIFIIHCVVKKHEETKTPRRPSRKRAR